MNYSEIFAKHGLVLVQAADVRRMMDAFQKANSGVLSDDNEAESSYNRLWDALHEVGLDQG